MGSREPKHVDFAVWHGKGNKCNSSVKALKAIYQITLNKDNAKSRISSGLGWLGLVSVEFNAPLDTI